MAAVCLDDNVAAEFVSGSLTGAAQTKVESHLAGCRDCRALVAALAADDGGDSDLATAPRPGAAAVGPGGGHALGDRIGRYLVIGRLGAGGMGVVFSAYDPQLDRRVAIKLLHTGTGIATSEGRARLVREAKAIAQLSHPNVVAVYDVGAAGRANPDDLYIAMELVEGDTLTHWLRRWPRSWREILEVMLQAGRGLAAAHAVGLLHRDFKPDNVLVGADGRVRVGDFGLARSLVGPEPTLDGGARLASAVPSLHASLTATGTVLGTPRFMAPEQLRGLDTDPRSDQFSFCVALYDALYGRHPLPGESAVKMAEEGARALPPPEGTKVPASIGRAILRGLEPQPSARHPSMLALLAELAPAPARPRRVAAMVGGALVIAGAAAAAVAVQREPLEVVQAGEETELVQQIETLRAERDQLLDRLRQREIDQRALETLRWEVEHKNEQIQQLIAEIERVRALPPAPAPTPTRPRPPTTPTPRRPDELTVAAVRATTGDLTGCFEEWARRYPDSDTTLNVELSVDAEGRAHSPRSTGAGSLPICVSDALKRGDYPATGSLVRLAIKVAYRGGAVVLEPRVLKVTPAGEMIDLGP
ncbi:MAG: protein kinase [Kofleriaceae bacterium]